MGARCSDLPGDNTAEIPADVTWARVGREKQAQITLQHRAVQYSAFDRSRQTTSGEAWPGLTRRFIRHICQLCPAGAVRTASSTGQNGPLQANL